jgi:hypothetical protein
VTVLGAGTPGQPLGPIRGFLGLLQGLGDLAEPVRSLVRSLRAEPPCGARAEPLRYLGRAPSSRGARGTKNGRQKLHSQASSV